ncbi:phosphate signaling complex protein PhoU [Neiella marina]|uniref:Phosphate-specific transport system accessory protein PhoU n=1 Tax=Neiella holothuriorum TaxID=2870530 RepID=A0ABS7EK32_9GAMM|nr:phosphate signaling complex protein PhoU [Neiella holothuriorum]MBW8192718.1 phosphate signaling complex protein PhoU [Neiella holothuriorum]
MDTGNLNKHISGQFNDELENVRSKILAMGGLVEQQLMDVLTAARDKNTELAQDVINTDDKVNNFEMEIDEECTRIIAKRQPTASDLRLMMTIVKTITDLERIGDLAESIARAVLRNQSSVPDVVKFNLEAMGEQIVKMLRNVLDAFARMDLKSAWDVHQSDRKVDSLHEGIVRQLLTYMMGDSRSIPDMLELLSTSRSLERVGDHCTNIAEYVIYNVTGKDIRHTSAAQIEQVVKSRAE